MTDEQQHLRDLLEAAVPDPPDLSTTGPGARGRWRRNRRRRIGTFAAVVAAAVVAVPAVRSISTRQETGPQISDTHLGPARSACQDVLSQDRDLGYLVDTRAVDSPTATAWLQAIHSSVTQGSVAAAQAVNVCLFDDKTNTYRILTGIPGREPVTVSTGKFDAKSGPLAAMQTLDHLWKGGAATTDAPFSCPSGSAADAVDVSAALPTGSTGALLCYGNQGTLYSPTKILSAADSDRLVALVDNAKIDYVAPNTACGGIPGFREYAVVLRYPTGTRIVRMEMCRGLAVGPFTRNVVANLDLRLERMLLSEGSASGPASRCRPDTTDRPSGVGDVRHIVAARYCAAGETGRGHVLSYTELHMLRHWGHHLYGGVVTEPEGKCTPPPNGRPHLELTDAWGNEFTMTAVRCIAYGHVRYLGGVLTSGPTPHTRFPLSEADRQLTYLLRDPHLRP